MSAFYFNSTFYSDIVNEKWQVQIIAKTLTAGTNQTIKLSKDGFKLKYSKGKDTKIAEIKPGTVTIGLIVENATDLTTINNILTTDEGEFYVKILKGTNGSLYWAGWIKPAYPVYKDQPFPYVINIKATDSLGRLLNKYNNSLTTSGSDDFKDLYHPLKLFYDTFDINSLPVQPISSFFGNVLTLFKWWPEELQYSTTVNAMRKIVYNRNAFVPDQENSPNVVDNYLREFSGVLKSFGMKCYYSNGFYWMVQDNSYEVDTFAWMSSPSPNGSEQRTSSGINITDFTINNDGSITNNSGKIKSGASFTLDPELNSVRARYIKGHTFATFDPTNNYSNLVTIGFVNQGQTQLNLTFNAIITETWQSSAVTPNAFQNGYMTGFLVCQLKVGGKYLNGNGSIGAPTSLGWEWSTDSNSVFILATGHGVNNSQAWNIQMYSLGLVTSYLEDTPSGFDTAKASIIVPNMSLPPLGPNDFGEVQFSMAPGIYYWQLPNASTGLVYGEMTIMDLVYGMNGQGLSTFGMPASSGLQYGTNTPASRTVEFGTSPFITSLSNGQMTSDTNPIGTTYISGQNPATQSIDKNLGNITLGSIEGEDASLHTLRLFSASTYMATGGFAIDNDTSYRDATQLLVNEYLKSSDKPTKILQATILSHSYQIQRPLIYQSTIGGDDEKYIFIEGTFTAAKDEWNGTWYNLDLTTQTPTETQDPIIVYPETNPQIDNGDLKPKPTPIPTEFGVDKSIQIILKSNVVGIVTTALSPNTSYTQINTGGVLAPIRTGQKIIICDRSGGNALELTTTNKTAQGFSTISASFTTRVGYDIGSKILVCGYDAAGVQEIVAGNNITLSPVTGTGSVTINSTGGGGGGTPGGSDTEVQYNNNGAFAGSSGLTFDDTNLILTVKNHYKGGNIGHRTLVTGNNDDVLFHLHPQDFMMTDVASKHMYTRTNGGSIQASAYRRGEEIFATTFLPKGYQIIAMILYMNNVRPYALERSNLTSSTVVNIDSGNANSLVTLTTPEATDYRNYYIFRVQPGNVSDEIYGATLTLEQI